MVHGASGAWTLNSFDIMLWPSLADGARSAAFKECWCYGSRGLELCREEGPWLRNCQGEAWEGFIGQLLRLLPYATDGRGEQGSDLF